MEKVKFSVNAFSKFILHCLKHLSNDCYGALIGNLTDNIYNIIDNFDLKSIMQKFALFLFLLLIFVFINKLISLFIFKFLLLPIPVLHLVVLVAAVELLEYPQQLPLQVPHYTRQV